MAQWKRRAKTAINGIMRACAACLPFPRDTPECLDLWAADGMHARRSWGTGRISQSRARALASQPALSAMITTNTTDTSIKPLLLLLLVRCLIFHKRVHNHPDMLHSEVKAWQCLKPPWSGKSLQPSEFIMHSDANSFLTLESTIFHALKQLKCGTWQRMSHAQVFV